MNKLKKVENNLVRNPINTSVTNSSITSNLNKNTHKTKISALIIIVCVISVGILGYFAGLQSGKGGVNLTDNNNTPEGIIQDKPDLHKSHSNSTEKAAALTDIKTSGLIPHSKKISDDLSELTFDEYENTTEPAHVPMTKNNVVSSDFILPSNISSTYSNDPAGGSNSGDSSKITILTSAINKAVEIPVTAEEDENNKKTLQSLIVLGVVKDESGMVALISGKELREGEKLRQFIVEEIAKDYVIFSFKKKTYKKLIR